MLGQGSRASVYLARATSIVDRPTGHAPDSSAPPEYAAIKIFLPQASRHSIDYEISALLATNSPHIVPLLDVATRKSGGIALVLARCTGGSLRELLGARSLSPGEAVNVLAPVVEALGAMHTHGFSHGSLRVSSVHFDSVGTPVVLGWGHGETLVDARTGGILSEHQRAVTPAVRADFERFVAVAFRVLDGVSGAGARMGTLRSGLEAVLERGRPSAVAELAELLYEFADPHALELPGENSATPSGMARMPLRPAARGNVPTMSPEPPPLPDDAPESARRGRRARERTRTRLPSWAAVFPLPDSFVSALRGAAVGRPKHALLERAAAELRTVRRPVWATAALATAALLAALLLVPAQTGGSFPAAGDAGSVPKAAADSEPAVPAPSTEEAGLDDGNERTHALAKSAREDDPVAAALALIQLRAHCFDTRSVLCLDGVDQRGSLALDVDRNAVRGLQEGRSAESLRLIDRTPVLIERLGNSAMIALPAPADASGAVGGETEPASLLIIKSEAGWRIREILLAGTATAG